uniref:Gustatory receptor n=1 Tax=Panagrellus redivivus TaxID=6233 RepID=A0A7E5A229_PANRE
MALQSPSTEPPEFPRPPLNGHYGSKVLFNAADEDIRNGIWGPWYWFAKCTGQLFAVVPGTGKYVTWLHHLPNVISIFLFVIRSIFLLYVMMKAKALSIFWSYVTVVFFMSLHAMVSAITLLKYKTDRFVPKVIAYMRKASFDRMTPVPKMGIIRNIFTVLIFVVPSLVYIFECFIRYSNDEEVFSEYYSGNSTFRNSIYGDMHFLYFFDAIIVLWGSFLSAAVMILYLLANDALCREYAIFNKELTAHVKDGTITNLTNIKSFQSQLIDYLCMACYLNTVSNAIVNLTFMAGIMTQIAAQFALYSFSAHMTGAQSTLYGIWTAQSILFLVYSLKKPSELHNMMTETKHLIWLDHGIWSKCSDQQVQQIARNISERISAVDYASKGMTSTRAANYLFNAVLIVIPFFVDILGGYKYVEPGLPAN